jgi:ribosome biogenesis GTPase / thiamine phosphate phosphatase
MHTLSELGWKPVFETIRQSKNSHRADELIAARITTIHKRHLGIIHEKGTSLLPFPSMLTPTQPFSPHAIAVGDWIFLQWDSTNEVFTWVELLPRQNSLARKQSSEISQIQPIAANVDTVIILMGLDADFSPKRVERYLTLIYESAATPVVILNKVDQCTDADVKQLEVEAVAPMVPVHTISITHQMNLDSLKTYFQPGQTVCLVGSSGVGKSTLVNYLMGQAIQSVRSIRETDSKGRHTTTRRDLLILPTGGILIDNPGMREVQLWADADSLEHTFSDVVSLAADCHFRDCTHTSEPGCAVLEAVEQGVLSSKRYESFIQYGKELAYLETRRNQQAKLEEKKRWKNLSKQIRDINKHRNV